MADTGGPGHISRDASRDGEGGARRISRMTAGTSLQTKPPRGRSGEGGRVRERVQWMAAEFVVRRQAVEGWGSVAWPRTWRAGRGIEGQGSPVQMSARLYAPGRGYDTTSPREAYNHVSQTTVPHLKGIAVFAYAYLFLRT